MMAYRTKFFSARLLTTLRQFSLCLTIVFLPTSVFGQSAVHCPDVFEIVDFGTYESGVFGEGPRSYGGILLNIGKRVKPKSLVTSLGVFCFPKETIGPAKQYFEDFQVPLVSRVYFGGTISFFGSGTRANKLTEKRWKAAADVWVKQENKTVLRGENSICIFNADNKLQQASEGYGCIATIEGMDFPDAYFFCGFGCGASFSLKNGLSINLSLGSKPWFLTRAETVTEARVAWEAFLLRTREDILNRIIERDDRFKVVDLSP
jgi:hypothetical protein